MLNSLLIDLSTLKTNKKLFHNPNNYHKKKTEGCCFQYPKTGYMHFANRAKPEPTFDLYTAITSYISLNLFTKLYYLSTNPLAPTFFPKHY